MVLALECIVSVFGFIALSKGIELFMGGLARAATRPTSHPTQHHPPGIHDHHKPLRKLYKPRAYKRNFTVYMFLIIKDENIVSIRRQSFLGIPLNGGQFGPRRHATVITSKQSVLARRTPNIKQQQQQHTEKRNKTQKQKY